jgi:hypothetical protein
MRGPPVARTETVAARALYVYVRMRRMQRQERQVGKWGQRTRKAAKRGVQKPKVGAGEDAGTASRLVCRLQHVDDRSEAAVFFIHFVNAAVHTTDTWEGRVQRVKRVSQ